jgi:hypothetical protein
VHWATSQYTQHHVVVGAGFLAPNSAIDYNTGTANHIAELPEQWASCFACGQQHGRCTVVNGSSPYDQFSPFRTMTVATYLSEVPSAYFAIITTVQRRSLP